MLAANEGVDPSELDPPLRTAIDPIELDALCRSEAGVTDHYDAQITFTYENNRVQVAETGAVTITDEAMRVTRDTAELPPSERWVARGADTTIDRENRRLSCTECTWSERQIDGADHTDPSKHAIDHYIETGHTIESAGDESNHLGSQTR